MMEQHGTPLALHVLTSTHADSLDTSCLSLLAPAVASLQLSARAAAAASAPVRRRQQVSRGCCWRSAYYWLATARAAARAGKAGVPRECVSSRRHSVCVGAVLGAARVHQFSVKLATPGVKTRKNFWPRRGARSQALKSDPPWPSHVMLGRCARAGAIFLQRRFTSKPQSLRWTGPQI